MSTHLKSEQLNDLLLGVAGNEAAAHLGACPQCRAEIEKMREALASFRTGSIRWSDEAAKQVKLPSQQTSRPLLNRRVWALATAAILLAVVIPLSMWRGHRDAPVATADAQAQIARDNQLLADIQSEIGETTPAPLQPLQVGTK